MKGGGFDLPSSIDVRPMGEQGKNAYAQMVSVINYTDSNSLRTSQEAQYCP